MEKRSVYYIYVVLGIVLLDSIARISRSPHHCFQTKAREKVIFPAVSLTVPPKQKSDKMEREEADFPFLPPRSFPIFSSLSRREVMMRFLPLSLSLFHFQLYSSLSLSLVSSPLFHASNSAVCNSLRVSRFCTKRLYYIIMFSC